MFDLGFSELFLIAVVALLVLGPERLPRAARFAGLWIRRARAQWHSVRSELETELAADELRRSLRQTQDELREAHDALQRGGAELRNEFAFDPAQPTADAAADDAGGAGNAAPVASPGERMADGVAPPELDAPRPPAGGLFADGSMSPDIADAEPTARERSEPGAGSDTALHPADPEPPR